MNTVNTMYSSWCLLSMKILVWTPKKLGKKDNINLICNFKTPCYGLHLSLKPSSLAWVLWGWSRIRGTTLKAVRPLRGWGLGGRSGWTGSAPWSACTWLCPELCVSWSATSWLDRSTHSHHHGREPLCSTFLTMMACNPLKPWTKINVLFFVLVG